MDETERLRELMKIAAGEPPHRVSVATVRRRVIRRRLLEGASALVAVALLAWAGVAAAASVPGRPVPSAGAAGPPRYYVQTDWVSAQTQHVLVRSTATGAVTAQIRSPQPGSATHAIAAADGQTFFIAWSGTGQTQIYRVRLGPTGQVIENAPIAGGSLGSVPVNAMGASPDGSLIAVAETGAFTRPPNQTVAVVVINTRTGTQSVWHDDPTRDGTTLTQVKDLVLARGGTELGFDTLVRCRTGAVCQGGNEVRVVTPATAGGELTSSRVVFHSSGLTGVDAINVSDAVLNPDSSTVVVLALRESGVVVERVRVGHASPPVVLYRGKPSDGYATPSFSTDPTGRYAMGIFGAASHPSNGWIRDGRLVPLQPSFTGDLGIETW
jgi:hypothetical protein